MYLRDNVRIMFEKDHTGMAFLYVLEYGDTSANEWPC